MSQISVVQWTSGSDAEANLEQLASLLSLLPAVRPQLVVIPEAFACFGAGESRQQQLAEPPGEGPIQDKLAELAERFGVWLVAGTIPLQAGEKYAAASLLFDDNGVQRARYDKIHLFDADVADGTKQYRESTYTRRGNQLCVVPTPFGQLGLAVCYDLRFPELFRALRQQGAELIALPSAFTQVTGKAHWQPLLQARAIENQCVIIAPGQTGKHPDGRETWGHSMIINAWGEVVASLGHGIGVTSWSYQAADLQAVRQRMQVQQHNRFEVSQRDE